MEPNGPCADWHDTIDLALMLLNGAQTIIVGWLASRENRRARSRAQLISDVRQAIHRELNGGDE